MTNPENRNDHLLTNAERELGKALRCELEDVAVPDDLWQRIRTTVQTEQSSQKAPGIPLWPRWVMASVLLALLAASPLLVTRWGQSDPALAELLIEEFHTFDISNRDFDVTERNPDALRQWFTSRLDFNPPKPITAIEKVSLVGGRLCQVDHHRMAAYMYQIDDHSVSLYIMADPNTDADKSRPVVRFRGYGYVNWQQDGLSYMMVSTLENDRLLHLAKVFNQQKPANFKSTPAQDETVKTI